MEKRGLFLSAVLFTLLVLAGCAEGVQAGRGVSPSQLVYEKNDSYMIGDFTIANERVEIGCNITVKNTGNGSVAFYMKGDFLEDQKGGLLKDRYIDAKKRDTDDQLFYIGKNESMTYQVEFTGNHGDKNMKQNRLPPEGMVFEVQEAASALPLRYNNLLSAKANNYVIKDGKVYINCYVEVTHSGETPIHFFMKGDFTEAQQRGLLKDRYAYAYCANMDDIKDYDLGYFDSHRKLFDFRRNKNWRNGFPDFSTFQLVFIGNYGGTDIQQEKLTPNAIEFEIQQNPPITDAPGVKP